MPGQRVLVAVQADDAHRRLRRLAGAAAVQAAEEVEVLQRAEVGLQRRQVAEVGQRAGAFRGVGGMAVDLDAAASDYLVQVDAPAEGSVRLFGEETVGLGESEAFALRRRFGMMFQHGALFSSLSVRENVAVPLREHTRLPDADIDRLAELKLALAGLPPGAGDKYPSQLSGGMIKRAGVARALALDPDLLFLDEPTAGLDPVGAAALDELVLELRAALGLTVLIVTHDLDTLWRITDRVAFLGERRVLACEPIAALSRRPHPLIRAYFCGPRARAAEAAAED